YDLAQETDLPPDLRQRLAFAEQKVREVVALARRLAGPEGPVPGDPDRGRGDSVPDPGDSGLDPGGDQGADAAREAGAGLVAGGGDGGAGTGRSPYPVRAAAQAAHLGLPPLPVTTIGS